MRQFLKEIRFAIKDAWQTRGRRKLPVDHSLARAIKDSTTIQPWSGAAGAGFDSDTDGHVGDGAKRYSQSFEDDAS